jgi:iron complex transport system substrate-binding protein
MEVIQSDDASSHSKESRLMAMRIVSLISSATEILFELGLGDQVVAVSHECDYPPAANSRMRVTRSNIDSNQSSDSIDAQVKQLTHAGAALYELDAQSIGQLQPDLIVTQSQCDVCAVRYDDVVSLVATNPQLRKTSILALNPMSLNDVLADILRIGSATDTVARAEKFVDSLQTRITAISDRTATIPQNQRPRTVCIEWTEPLMLAANWTPELMELAGGRNDLSKAGEHSGYSSWSEVLHYDPEVVIVSPCGFDLNRSIQDAETLSHLDGWRSLSAVRTGRVFAVDGNAYLNRSGPRLVESLEILACLIQPSLNQDLRSQLQPRWCSCVRAISHFPRHTY